MDKVKEAFEDLLRRLQTDYIDLGMIHFVDQESEFHQIFNGEFIEYVRELKQKGIIRYIGLSSHNPHVAKLAALSDEIEVILFSLNPAFDMLPGSEDINDLFKDHYSDDLKGIAPERNELYMICERENVGITVMKGYAGGRLFNAEHSPFGVALTPVQCLHYALTRPAVASVMVGCRTPEEVDAAAAYEEAND
jgi:predicted aldo/keto reductase-like oxidoreductase